MSEVSYRVKCERLKKNLNQSELSKMLNVSKQEVSCWEEKSVIPSSLSLCKMANIFNCSVDYLLGKAENREGIISEADINGHHYEFELDKNIFPSGITREQMIGYIKELEKREKEGNI